MGESIKESRISGGDRAVAWDGETRGPQLTAQLKAISEQKAGCVLPWCLWLMSAVAGEAARNVN